MFRLALISLALITCATLTIPTDPDESILSAFDLPVLSPSLFIDKLRKETQELCGAKMHTDSGGDRIPHHLWIAVKDESSSYLSWPNVKSEIDLNPSWSVHICDNDAKDSFMANFFPNTSLLLSYNNINPVIAGASKADIWRYAVLYVFGGVYIDSDSQLTKPLNGVIKPGDEMIVAVENNVFDGDWCYSPNSEFATRNVFKKYPHLEKTSIFKGRILTNWCIMSAPDHALLLSAMSTFVALSKLEYVRLSNLKISMWDPFSKYVYCSTGPSMFTAAARKAVIELHGNGTSYGGRKEGHNEGSRGWKDRGGDRTASKSVHSYRLASKDFNHEGGIFKAVRITKSDKNHYTQIVPARGQPLPSFLLKYAPLEESKKAVRQYR